MSYHERREVKEMLEQIMKDGVKYMAAWKVGVHWEGDGFSMWVDGEEYGWYPDIKSILPDIMEFRENRPFPARGDILPWLR
jgi:hypothetical protein